MRAVRYAAACAAFAAACGAGDAAVRAPDIQLQADDESGRWFLISCADRRTTCTRKAALLCPGGYLVVNAHGYQIPAALAGLTEVHNGKLRVRCMPSFIVEGR